MSEENCCNADKECEPKSNSLTDELIQSTIKSCEITKLGQKTTCCLLTLKNGFEICETAACVDPANYSAEIGGRIARERAVAKVWELEGYKLQSELGNND